MRYNPIELAKATAKKKGIESGGVSTSSEPQRSTVGATRDDSVDTNGAVSTMRKDTAPSMFEEQDAAAEQSGSNQHAGKKRKAEDSAQDHSKQSGKSGDGTRINEADKEAP